MPERVSIRWCKSFQITENCTNCHISYTGETCDTNLLDDLPFMTFMAFSQVFSISMFFLLLLWNIVGWYGKMKSKHGGALKLNSIVAYLNMVLCIGRFIFMLDPYGFYSYLPGILTEISMWVPISAMITSYVLCNAVWFDIVVNKSNGTVNSLKTAITMTIVFSILFFFGSLMILVVTFILGALGVGVVLMHVLLLLCIASSIVLALIMFSKVARQLKKASKKRQIIKLERYLIMGMFITGGVLCVGLTMTTLHNVSRTNEPSYHIILFIVALVSRILEILLCAVTTRIALDAPRKAIMRAMNLYDSTSSSKSKLGSRLDSVKGQA